MIEELLLRDVQAAHEAVNTRQEIREFAGAQMEILRDKHFSTYMHSLRMGMLGYQAGSHLQKLPQERYGINFFNASRTLLLAGQLHDVGKQFIVDDVLKKPGKFDEDDHEIMEDHVDFSYHVLKAAGLELTAHLALRHHLHQADPYPDEIKPIEIEIPEKLKARVEFYSKVLSVMDAYDAMTTREDGRGKRIEPTDKHKLVRSLAEIRPTAIPLIHTLVASEAMSNGGYI